MVKTSDLSIFPGRLLGEQLAVLLDDGSQVNLINEAVVRKLKLPTRHIKMEIGWFGAERRTITQVLCDTDITMGAGRFSLRDALVAPLENYDVIFGAGFRDFHHAEVKYSPHRGRQFKLLDEDGKSVILRPGKHRPRRFQAVDVGYCSITQAETWLKQGAEAYPVFCHKTEDGA